MHTEPWRNLLSGLITWTDAERTLSVNKTLNKIRGFIYAAIWQEMMLKHHLTPPIHYQEGKTCVLADFIPLCWLITTLKRSVCTLVLIVLQLLGIGCYEKVPVLAGCCVYERNRVPMCVFVCVFARAEPSLDGSWSVYTVYSLLCEGRHVQLCPLPLGAVHWRDSLCSLETW